MLNKFLLGVLVFITFGLHAQTVNTDKIVTHAPNERWAFAPKYSDADKFVFRLKTDNKGNELLLTCNQFTKHMSFKLHYNGVVYRYPEFDSVTNYTPDNALRDSLLIGAGPSLDKIISFFDNTSNYFIILKNTVMGPFYVAPKSAAVIEENSKICAGLDYRLTQQ